MRARDYAGNISHWVDLPWGVYIDPLLNGGFAGGSLVGWDQGGALPQTVITGSGPEGEAFLAQLGSPDFGPNVPGVDIPDDSPGTVPVGSGAISTNKCAGAQSRCAGHTDHHLVLSHIHL